MRKVIIASVIGACALAVGACVPVEQVGNGSGSVSPPPSVPAIELPTTKAPEAEITLAEFDQIKTGMTYDQVTAIIGSNGQVSSESNFGNYHSKSYQYFGKMVNFMQGNSIISFQNGVVDSKMQFGLS